MAAVDAGHAESYAGWAGHDGLLRSRAPNRRLRGHSLRHWDLRTEARHVERRGSSSMSGALQKRLYGAYVTGGQARAPSDLRGLAPRVPYFKRLVKDHFPDNRSARVVDLGAGYGALVHVARLCGYTQVEGIDGAQEQVDAAQALGIEGIRCGDLLASLREFSESSVDVVVTFDVLEHFEGDELVEIVDAVHHCLRPGGRWILHVPNGESPFFGAPFHGDLTHKLAFTRQSISQLLLASGFSSTSAYEDAPIVHGLFSFSRALAWAAIRTGLRIYSAVETGETSGHVFTRNLLAVGIK